jgi:hypothetical protein
MLEDPADLTDEFTGLARDCFAFRLVASPGCFLDDLEVGVKKCFSGEFERLEDFE